MRNDNSRDRYTQSKDRAIVAARWFDEASSSDLHQWLVTRLHHASARQPIRWLELVRVHPEHPDGDGTIFDQVKKQLKRFLTSPNHDRQDSRCIEFIARKLIAAAADAIIAEREQGTSSATSDSPQREIEALLHPEFVPEYRDLHEDVQDVLRRGIELLGRYGPQLGRPYVDTIRQSRHPNMKELRFDAAGGTWRVAFAFDPSRQPVLLAAGDKSSGSQERFYDRLIKKADERFGAHVAKMESR
ncbi:MAG TPA: type II toxin-antitoxin system RelE/ParE family toxin [Bryobacteraceae bacterium]|nr:type II toxin-antitoxin system RelE/ParE family toxin [Bryobacteraceae bacterium]